MWSAWTRETAAQGKTGAADKKWSPACNDAHGVALRVRILLGFGLELLLQPLVLLADFFNRLPLPLDDVLPIDNTETHCG
jgi:hypothetical protein